MSPAEERILKGLAEIYKQNLQILNRLEVIEKSVGTVERTNLKPALGKRPWEGGWSKDKQPETEEPDTIPPNVKDTFKL